MSTLWTPDGEHPVEPAGSASPTSGSSGDGITGGGPGEPDEAQAREMARQMAEAQEALAQAPVDQVVSNHVMGLFELAAIHLRKQPPDLVSARLPIDAMGLLIDNLGDRLFESETLAAALNQLRMAYVELARAGETDDDAAPHSETDDEGGSETETDDDDATQTETDEEGGSETEPR